MDTLDAILLGSVTYRMFAKHWPKVTEGEEKAFADKLNSIPKIVFSQKVLRAEGERQVLNRQKLLEIRHVSVSVNRPPEAVYGFAAAIENLPKWAAGLCKTIRNVNSEWIADGPVGKVKVRFAERNAFGVLDHDVVLESGATIHNPIRVVPKGAGSEVMFTLLRQPGVSAEDFAEDATAVERDLRTLKALLEEMAAPRDQ